MAYNVERPQDSAIWQVGTITAVFISIDSFWFCSAQHFCLYDGALQIELTKIGSVLLHRSPLELRWPPSTAWLIVLTTNHDWKPSIAVRYYIRLYLAPHPVLVSFVYTAPPYKQKRCMLQNQNESIDMKTAVTWRFRASTVSRIATLP